MIIYPAIDIKNGKCVRLKKGDFNQVTEFKCDVVEQGKKFEEAGFKWLHIVDLDGAKNGLLMNFDLVKQLAEKTNLKIQFGGGVRNIETIKLLVEIGVQRIVLGTSAIENHDFLLEACNIFPKKIAIGLDARGDKIATNAWLKESEVSLSEFLFKIDDLALAAIIYTDINRDGMMNGFNEEKVRDIAYSSKIPIIVSGGVSTIDDLSKVKELEGAGIVGAIIGRAFYEEKIAFSDALKFHS